MEYVEVQFRSNNNPASWKGVKVLVQPHWNHLQIESVARMQSACYDDYTCIIPKYGYINNPGVGSAMSNDYNTPNHNEMVPAENQALWCEITHHAFSAKDPDMMFVKLRGENKLGCGKCTGALFQGPVADAPKPLVA
jgi:hypothetical protein